MSYPNSESRSTVHHSWTGRRVLITGGTGFLGQHLTRQLADLGAHVTVLCEEADHEETVLPPEIVTCWDGDVRNYDHIRQLVESVAPEFVFHLAAVGVNDPFIAEETAIQVNLQGTINLLRAIHQGKSAAGPTRDITQRIVVAGTSYEYGKSGKLDPGNVYAASKVAAWAFCRMYYRAYGTPVVVIRPFNVYGPGQNPRALVPSAIQAALSAQDFPMTPGEQQRDFIFIDDVVTGFLAVAIANGIEGRSLDLGTGQATPVRDIVERVFALIETDGRPQIGALPYRPSVIWQLVADARRTKRLTGWQAKTSLEEGLNLTIQALTRM